LITWHDREDTLLPESHNPVVQEIVEGVIANTELLRALLDYIQVEGDFTLMRQEYCLYEIFIYLYLFRLQELTFETWGELLALKMQPQHRLRILNFLLSLAPQYSPNAQEVLESTVHTVYHHEHTQKLLKNVYTYAEELHQLKEGFSPEAPAVLLPSRPKKQNTVPMPFTLTEPSRRLKVKPRRVSSLPPSKPAPKTTYRPSLPPAAPQRKLVPHFTPPVIVEPVVEQAPRPNKYAQSPLSTHQPPVQISKETNSTILRASYLLSKKLESKTDAHITLFDGEALRHAEVLREEDLARAEALKEKARLEVLLGREIAIEKRKEAEQLKIEVAAIAKQETLELVKQREQEEKLEAERNRELIRQIQISEEAAKEAVRKAAEEKQRNAILLAQEHDKVVRRAQAEAEAEHLQRVELMKQIRIMEAQAKEERANRPKEIDLSVPERGILGEMSVVELLNRLNLLRVEEEEIQRRKREDIIDLRRQQAEAMARKVKELEMYRQMEKDRVAQANTTSKPKKVRPVDPTLEQMRMELERRKSERLGTQVSKETLAEQPKIIVSIRKAKNLDYESVQRTLQPNELEVG